MPDGKYGTIYTEADVRLIARNVAEQEISSEEELNELLAKLRATDQLTFPEDEPLFILRGQDKSAASTLDEYRWQTSEDGAEKPHVEAVDKAIKDFEDFAQRNDERMKVAD